jgi:hypothetical protein
MGVLLSRNERQALRRTLIGAYDAALQKQAHDKALVEIEALRRLIAGALDDLEHEATGLAEQKLRAALAMPRQVT